MDIDGERRVGGRDWLGTGRMDCYGGSRLKGAEWQVKIDGYDAAILSAYDTEVWWKTDYKACCGRAAPFFKVCCRSLCGLACRVKGYCALLIRMFRNIWRWICMPDFMIDQSIICGFDNLNRFNDLSDPHCSLSQDRKLLESRLRFPHIPSFSSLIPSPFAFNQW